MSAHPRHPALSAATAILALSVTALSAAPAALAGTDAAKAVHAASFDGTVAFGRRAAAALLTGSDASSISVALTDGDRVVWQETFGAVDAAGTPPSADTMYGIGSVSKTFAAVAVLTLVDAGLVDLDTPFVHYVPSFRMATPDAAQITVRMLLDHSAGLPGSDYANGITSTPYDGYLAQVLDGLRGERLKTTPGSMGVYCNDCFTLVEALVPAVTGRSYQDYVTDTILRPLGMDHSRFPTTPFPDGTWAPVLGTDGTPAPLEILNLLATGALYSTPTDLSRIGAMLLGGGTLDGVRVLSRKAVAEMTRIPTSGSLQPVVDDVWLYGLGLDTVRQAGLDAVGQRGWYKGGDTNIYHSAFMLAPDADLGVAVLSAGRTMSSAAAETLAERVLLRALVERHTLRAMPRPITAADLPAKVATTPAHPAIDGIYLTSEAALRVQTGAQGLATVSTLVDGAWTGAPDGFQLRADGRYWGGAGGLQGLSVVSAWGREYLVARSPHGAGHAWTDGVVAQRVRPVGPLTPAWTARVGHDWVPVDEISTSTGWSAPAIHLGNVPDLGGLVRVSGGYGTTFVDGSEDDDLGSSFLVIPGLNGRDLADLAVEHRPEGDWLRMGSSLLQPVDSIPTLTTGRNVLTIDPEGAAAWLRAEPNASPATQVRTTGASAWKTLDADLALVAAGTGEADDVKLPAGGYLVVFGGPGDTVTVSAG